MPDFKNYSLDELKEVYDSVHREKYPEIFQAVVDELNLRKMDCETLFKSAKSAHEKNGCLQVAQTNYERIISAYPNTDEAREASVLLKKIVPEQEKYLIGGQEEMTLIFKGSSKEYFRIWIVNLCLTLLTFGFFSAWSKVRKKRYFYSHLVLDDTPFQYLGQPVPILKGRIIAVILFLLYYLSRNVFTGLFPYALVIGFFLAPWVIVKSLAFNCRYSAYRNMTFRFNGNYSGALKVVFVWGLIPSFIIGTLFDWWGKLWLAGIVFLMFGILFPYWLRRFKDFIISNTSYGGQTATFEVTGGTFFQIYVVSGLIILGFLFVIGMTTAIGSSVIKGSAYIIMLTVIPLYFGYILAYAYVQANITNAVWKGSRLGPIRFLCTLKSVDLAKLYITNAIGIIISCGFLIPWAVIRTFQYRIDHTRVINTSDLMAFQGDSGSDVDAVGGELTEFFDMDLSL